MPQCLFLTHTAASLVVVAMAMAISNAAAAEVQAPRALVFLSDDSLAPQLQLGFTRAQVVTLRREGTITVGCWKEKALRH